MLIDCDQCAMQHTAACEDCIVTALLGHDAGPVVLGEIEATALQNLAEAGMVAPLRLVRRDPGDRDAAAG